MSMPLPTKCDSLYPPDLAGFKDSHKIYALKKKAAQRHDGGEHDCLTFPDLHEPENSIDRINLLALRQGNKYILSAVSP